MNPTRFQLLEKLRQSKLTAALTRSKVITKSATPVMDAIAAEAKLRGVSCDDLVGDWVAGKVKLTALDTLVSPTATASAKPHGLDIKATAAKPTPAPKNPMPKKPAPQKPAHQTAYSTFAKLQEIDMVKASVFLAVNRAAILASKPADVTIQF